jgi:hypothetical protein
VRIACLTLGVAIAVVAVSNQPVVARAQGGAAVHIGHVMDSFMNTPGNQGLLPMAMAEAKVAAQHAALGAKAADNLAGMKLHAGHVLNALDPSVEASGPGAGYGVKRAATGVAQHVQLAAKAADASAGVKTHATHVTASANGVVKRCDEMAAVIAKLRAATTPAEAAPLAAQLSTLAAQLTSGVDANGDGTIGWQEAEGGLAQAQTHMELLRKSSAMW